GYFQLTEVFRRGQTADPSTPARNYSAPTLRMKIPSSLRREPRRTLLEVRCQTLFRIGAVEEQLRMLALQRQACFDGDLPSRLHRSLDAADGLRRFIRRA